MNIIKLGGSLITDPGQPDCYAAEVVGRLAREFAAHPRPAIFVHGTGHVGKPPARAHGYVDSGRLEAARRSLGLEIKANIRQLNCRVAETFLKHGAQIVPLAIETLFSPDQEHFLSAEIPALLHQYLNNGLTPLLYGDFMPLASGDFQVFSSDRIVTILARELRPRRVIFLTSVAGVYADAERRQILRELRPADLQRLALFRSDQDDVSGGMREKIRHALQIAATGAQCFIAGGREPDDFARLLNGDSAAGTRILAE